LDIVDWTNHLVASVRELEPQFGTGTSALLREVRTGGPPKDSFIASFISELGALEPLATVLVVEDFHLVDGSTDANDFILRLARDGPPWLSILLASRREPGLELSRLAAENELQQLDTDELRFSEGETGDLFSTSFKSPLDSDVLALLFKRTRGWAASLQLFHRSIQGRSPAAIRALAQALSGADSPMYDFLAEEVVKNLPQAFEETLVRAALLSDVSVPGVAAITGDSQVAVSWIKEAAHLGFLALSGESSDPGHLHPLLQDFLLRRLHQQLPHPEIAALHISVADALKDVDPLAAAHHFVEAGDTTAAMDLLGKSILLSVGSGKWGIASTLMTRLSGVATDPAVAAVYARQLMEQGEVERAEEVLALVDLAGSGAEARAVFRHTQVSLGWRTGNRKLMFDALTQIHLDEETPAVIRDIAEVLLDASPIGVERADLPDLARRLRRMAATMANQQLMFYSAIGLHDAAVAYANAGEFWSALQVGSEALDTFAKLSFFASEQLSTHALMAVCEQELGRDANAEAHRAEALEPGTEFADVPAEMAMLMTLNGEPERAAELIGRGRLKQRQHLSDAVGDALLESAAGALELRSDLARAIHRLETVAFDSPLELGYGLGRDALYAQSMLLAGRDEDAWPVVARSLATARGRGARRAEVRLAILQALLARDRSALQSALTDAEQASNLAILETCDAILSQLEWIAPLPQPILTSIERHPKRWLPGIRRQLEAGNTPNARIAASLLDSYGELGDVGLLRAYAKTYVKRGPGRYLGVALARRASPVLTIHDLGRIAIEVGDRLVRLTAMRRKSAATLMYLVTRPGLTANREQLVDAIWPDADPISATNSLNQSLYFLRREIDPWYEDGLSVDYIELQGDLVWLDRDLVRADSASVFQMLTGATASLDSLADSIRSYGGQFAPEFEYDEWALAWRGRVHSTFLDVAHTVIDRLVAANDLRRAGDVAGHVISVDPAAMDIEQRLIWIYGRMGKASAARSQYEHLRRQDAIDGLDTPPLAALLAGPMPK
jgi:DNA-binding SARP family transcriptional activator